MKIKKLLALLLSFVLAFSCISVVPFTAVAEEATPVATETEDAIFIGKATEKQLTNVFIPLNARNTKADGTGTDLVDDHYFKVTFKAKMLSGDKPIMGFVRTNYGAKGSYTEQGWVDNTDTDTDGDFLYTSYDETTGIFEGIFKATVSDNYDHNKDDKGQGNRWGFLTIGNAEHNDSWHGEYNYNVSFIMSDIEVKYYDTSTGEVSGDSIVPSFSDESIDFKGTYFHRSNSKEAGTEYYDGFYYATANKWHIDTSPKNVKHIEVPVDYNTSAHYNAGNFTQTAETDYTREFYTNANYSDLYFEKLTDSNDKGFAVITSDDINKKVIIIDANHENESDNRTYESGYKPSRNRKANIFIPLSLTQYVNPVNGNVGDPSNQQCVVKVTVKVKVLEGDAPPVLGRVVGNDNGAVGNGAGTCSEGLGKMANNKTADGSFSGTWFNNSEHEKYYDSNGSLLTYSYNPETEELVGYLRMKSGDAWYTSVWGVNEVLTVGNAENIYTKHTYDSTEFNCSYAISDVKVDVYKATSPNYTMGQLIATDIAPDFYADNIDTTTTWQYVNYNGGSYSSNSKDIIRASQKLWSVDGAPGLVHAYDYTECFAKHTLTHHEATDTTREYYSCSCGKNYADAYANEQITDTSATKQMIVVQAAGEKMAQTFIPLKLRGYGGNGQFIFKTKLKALGADAEPVLNLYIARDKGQVGGATVDGDCKVVSQSYDKATGEFTAIIQVWRPSNYNNPHSRPHYCYDEPTTGNNFLFVLGNMKKVNNGGSDNKYYTSFAFTEPELYRIKSSSDTTMVDGINLMSPITDKTVDFESEYQISDFTSNYFSNTYSSPMTAPTNKWGCFGNGTNKIFACDVPNGFFEGEADPAQMLQLLGDDNNRAINYQTYLEPGATYQLDIDYRAYGGAAAQILPRYASGSSYTDATMTTTAANVDGSHYSAQFTMPSDARKSYNGNFMLYLGQTWPTKRNTSIYFANVKLRKVTDGVLGENIIMNGEFNYTDNSIINTNNISDNLITWATDGKLGTQAKTMSIPDGFFTGDATWPENIVLKYSGGDWNELRFKVQLEADTTYRLTYNYRGVGDLPTFDTEGTGSVTVNDLGSTSNGKYLQTYELTTSADKTARDDTQTNTTIKLKFGVDSADKAIYIANVKLHKVVDGEIVGTNLVGHLNPMIDNTSDIKFDIAGDDALSLTRGFAQGWLSSKAVKASLISVEDDFFNVVPFAQLRAELRDMLLNVTTVVEGPDTNTNNDSAVDICDLVYMKNVHDRKEAGTNYSGADDLYDEIMSAGNTAITDTSKVYYVSNSGTNSRLSVQGKSEDRPYKTLQYALERVGTKTGYTILLKRGEEFRTEEGSEFGFVIPSGTTLGAYGTGDKPVIIGSNKNYATATWTNEGGNVWSAQVVSSSSKHDVNIPGNVYFFNSYDDEEPALIGTVIKDGHRFTDMSQMTTEGDIYITGGLNDAGNFVLTKDNFDGKIYVYCDQNPATKYGRIEVAEKHDVIFLARDTTNVTIDNVDVKFGGGHGINARISSNVTITNCEVGYMGGAPLHEEVFGNGIQFGQNASNITVNNCYIHDCYDAGLTFQAWQVTDKSSDEYVEKPSFSDINFTNNLITNNYYNIELFTVGTSDYKVGASYNYNGEMKNINISGNILRFAGDCWAYAQRVGGEESGLYRCANICVTKNAYYINTSNFNIVNNIFDGTVSSHLYWTWKEVTAPLTDEQRANHVGLTISGNSYYQYLGAKDSRVMMFGDTSSYDYASSLAGLEKSVENVDSNPKTIAWLDTIP